MTRTSIIIAVHNQAEELKKCLTAIETTYHPGAEPEIIVVDNNSSEDIKSVVNSFEKIKYLEEKKPGAAFARNKGISEAVGDILIFLDADSVPSKNWLSNIVRPFLDDSVGAVGGAIFPINPQNMLSRYLGVSLFLRYPCHGAKRPVKGFPSCNLAVRRDLVGEGFDTEVFTTYAEDKDLCYRVIAKGKKVVFEPDAVVRHHNAESFNEFLRLLTKSSRGRAAFGKKYRTAPDILFFNAHLPLIYAILLILSAALGSWIMFLLLVSPVALALLYNSIVAYFESRDAFTSLIVKPVLDCFSAVYIYIVYSLEKHA
jgi:O-antigen biosynthesis protein